MNNQDNFNFNFERFTSSIDPKEHKESTRRLLSQIKLEDEFNARLNEGSKLIKNFFQSFKNASLDTSIPEIERISMVKIGSQATRYIKNNQYHKLADLAFNLVFRNLTDFLQLSKRKDFNKLTFQNLYHKRLLPPEVFFQFFLLETLANEKIYNWNRNKIIVDQSLVCLEVCFSDIYRFLHYADSADASKNLPSIPQITEESFKNAVKRTIADNSYTDYMQNLLKQYEEYKQFFSQVWTTDNPAGAIYEFRAAYLKKDP